MWKRERAKNSHIIDNLCALFQKLTFSKPFFKWTYNYFSFRRPLNLMGFTSPLFCFIMLDIPEGHHALWFKIEFGFWDWNEDFFYSQTVSWMPRTKICRWLKKFWFSKKIVIKTSNRNFIRTFKDSMVSFLQTRWQCN